MPVPAVGIGLLLEYGHDAVLVVRYRLDLLEGPGCRFEKIVADIEFYDFEVVVLCELFDLFMDMGCSGLDCLSRNFAIFATQVSTEARLVLEILDNAIGYDPVEAFVAELYMVENGLVREDPFMEKDKDKETQYWVDVGY